MSKTERLADLPEWVYPRPDPDGDLTAFAATAEEALAVMAQGGYAGLDPKRLRKTSRRLGDELAAVDGSEGAESGRTIVEKERRALGLASTLPAPPDTVKP